jgi:Fe-S cluster assembly protein SufD
VSTGVAQSPEPSLVTGLLGRDLPGGPPWLDALRKDAGERFTQMGLPTTRNEDWKFTNVAPVGQVNWQAPGGVPGLLDRSVVEPFRLGLPDAIELVFVNGWFAPHLSDVSRLPASVTVTSLALAIQAGVPAVEQWLGKTAKLEHQPFTALNQAMLVDGGFIQVPRGVSLAAPLHLLFLSDAASGPAVTHPRTLILAEESAELVVIESYASLRESLYFTNAVTEVVVGPNARVEHIKIERESEQAYHVGTVEADQQRDSRFRSFSFAIGGSLVRTNIYSVMNGEGSDCTMNGLYLLHERQHIDHQTRIEHAFPHCSSREVYKGILDGASHAVFNGKVFVRPEAQKTDGKQTNKNLLLSDQAKVDTKPQLEIFADDVKCTHGATVGSLDAIGLFYLESRGISQAAARRLLTYGFAAEVLGEINHDTMRRQLERLVFERLETSVR